MARTNAAAVRRAAGLAARQPIGGQWSHHHLHASDYLVHTASAYACAAVPARLALEREAWDEAVAVPARWPSTIPWDDFPHLEAMPVFARALGAARHGDLETAEQSLHRLRTLRAEADALPTPYDWGLQVRIQELAAQAWIHSARQNVETALALMAGRAARGHHPEAPG